MVEEEIREGYYQDRFGVWQKDRRVGIDRRAGKPPSLEHDRRRMFRRKADRELFERDHREMIEEALNEFAAEHDGHL